MPLRGKDVDCLIDLNYAEKTFHKRESKAVDGDGPNVAVPRGISFYEFMHQHAQVRVGNKFVPYSTAGREPLRICIGLIDYVLGNDISYLTQSERATIGALRGVQSSEFRVQSSRRSSWQMRVLISAGLSSARRSSGASNLPARTPRPAGDDLAGIVDGAPGD